VDRELINRRLKVVRILAIIDLVLLVPLVAHGVLDLEFPIFVLGMTHGLLFIALVLLVARGALEKHWGWWFPVIVVVTGGPPGTFIGEVLVRRRLSA